MRFRQASNQAGQWAQHRAYASLLLMAVLEETMTPSQAILQWPNHVPGQVASADPSLEAAYQALWHFECDDTWQQSDVFYLDAQLMLLKTMATQLAANQDFPKHLCDQYPRSGQVKRQSEWQFWLGVILWPVAQVARLWQTLKAIALPKR
jgi:hypothetical protein